MGLTFKTADDENDWIDDNGDHQLARYDREGRAYYADRRLAGSSKPAAPRAAVSETTKAARASLKSIGYRALTGTAKQKEWAEKIRKGIVEALDEDVRGAFVEQPFKSAAFWIENRFKTPAQFAHFAREDTRLHGEIWALHSAEKFQESRELRDSRTRLHAEWKI